MDYWVKGVSGEVPGEAPGEAVAATFSVERLRAAIVGDESTLNPYTYITGFPGWNILTMQYDTLFTLDLTGTPQPWLVADWDLSEDGTVYTLTLRDDVYWNDGEPFTAEDVKFTFEYYTANKHGRWTRGIGGFSTAEVVGDHQVVITLEEANPPYVQLAFGDVPIIPKHIWEGIENPAEHVFDSVTMWAPAPTYCWNMNPIGSIGLRPTPTTSPGLPRWANWYWSISRIRPDRWPPSVQAKWTCCSNLFHLSRLKSLVV